MFRQTISENPNLYQIFLTIFKVTCLSHPEEDDDDIDDDSPRHKPTPSIKAWLSLPVLGCFQPQ
jgi:hypothetical protein